MVGGAVPHANGIGRSVIVIVGNRGTSCSGTVLTPRLVLTAAHCVVPGAQYKLVEYRAGEAPRLIDIARVSIHPRFEAAEFARHRVTADIALVKLAADLPGAFAPARLGMPRIPIQTGARFTVAGAGVAREGDGASGGRVRAASLAVTGRPGTLQIRLVDPLTQGQRAGLGACTGDSGAPAFEDQNGAPVVVGVVSWSTGPNLSAGCGGLTGLTPLTRHIDWIVDEARRLGAPLS